MADPQVTPPAADAPKRGPRILCCYCGAEITYDGAEQREAANRAMATHDAVCPKNPIGERLRLRAGQLAELQAAFVAVVRAWHAWPMPHLLPSDMRPDEVQRLHMAFSTASNLLAAQRGEDLRQAAWDKLTHDEREALGLAPHEWPSPAMRLPHGPGTFRACIGPMTCGAALALDGSTTRHVPPLADCPNPGLCACVVALDDGSSVRLDVTKTENARPQL